MFDPVTTYLIAAPAAIAVVFLTWFIVAEIRRPHPVERDVELATTTGLMRAIRRHDGTDATHSVDVDAQTTIVLSDIARIDSSHWALSNEPWQDSAHPLEAPALGRRHADNPYRVIVPADWRPPIGETRIAILDTPTSEYKAIITRRPQARQLVW